MITLSAPTCARVRAALRLQPMTVRELMRVLAAPRSTIYWAVLVLEDAAIVRREPCVHRPRGHRASMVWSLSPTQQEKSHG